MSPPLIFFSDAHLGAPLLNDDKAREKKVIELLEHAARLNAVIYIVGDLFEFWFEYQQAIPKKNFAVLAKLWQLTSSGAEIHYLAGNHDMWLGKFLRDELGLITHQNETRIQHEQNDIIVTHGDGVANSDNGYRFLKRIFRNKLNIALYRLIHPDFGIPFAKKMSQVSRKKSFTVDPLAKEYRMFALGAFDILGANVVIMGHTHEAKHEIFADKHYINLGDWISHYSYCQIQNGEISIRQWPSTELYVQPVVYKEIPVNGHQQIAGALVKK
ncbi:MAG: UDP-2,3-diacylglucosamine diphosphatase [bacterium]